MRDSGYCIWSRHRLRVFVLCDGNRTFSFSSGRMLSYFSRVGPRPESSGSFSSIAGFEKELPRTPVKDVLSSEEDEDKKKNASPTQLRLEDLGTYPLKSHLLNLCPFCSGASQSHLFVFL